MGRQCNLPPDSPGADWGPLWADKHVLSPGRKDECPGVWQTGAEAESSPHFQCLSLDNSQYFGENYFGFLHF